MTATELKIPISCRVYPDLKSEIEEEAQDEGLTTSMYLEKILVNRHGTQNEEEDDADFTNVYQYEVENEELKSEVETLTKQIARLEGANKRLSARNLELEAWSEKLDIFDLENDELDKLGEMLEKLQKSYPDQSPPQLLLACVHAALKNEDSIFFIHTPSGYFE
jgi:DNA repair exonuclease SbcCD ATPase subunit